MHTKISKDSFRVLRAIKYRNKKYNEYEDWTYVELYRYYLEEKYSQYNLG